MFRWHWVLVCVCILCSAPSLAENARQLTHPPTGFSDAYLGGYSPRGDKIAFARHQHGDGILTTVFVADVSTGSVDSLVTGLPVGWSGKVEWSPDGTQIAFIGDEPGVGLSIWIADVAGPVVPRVLATTEPTNSGAYLALASDGVIYQVDLNGNGPISSEVVGNLFGGPPPSPILTAGWGDRGGLMATLKNGDVWQWIGNDNLGVRVGNIFLAAGVSAVAEVVPARSGSLYRARPNPFNPSTRLPFSVSAAGRVKIQVFDVTGRLVRTLEDGNRPAGQHTVEWDGRDESGRDSASGTYFGRITFPDGSTAERKMTIVR